MVVEMTSRERVTKLLRRELPDRMGIFEHFWGETIGQFWVKEGYPEGTPPEDYFDYDLRWGGGGVDSTPMRDVWEVVEESDEWRLVRQGNGATMRYWKNKSGTPEHVDFDCSTPERWEEVYKPPLLKLDPDRVDVEGTKAGIAAAHERGKFCCFSGLFIFELLRSTLGDYIMLESLALNPEWTHDFCRTYTDFFIRHMDYLFEHAGQPDGAFVYEDLGYNKGLFCSPRMLRELILPYHKELCAYFHNRGMPVILHSCGGITEAVPEIIEAGFDCLQPMEAKAGVDVVSLATRYGNQLSFMGNIDIRVLEEGDKDRIEREVGGKMEALKSLGAAYFLHTDHSVSPRVSFGSYKYALDVFRAHCSY